MESVEQKFRLLDGTNELDNFLFGDDGSADSENKDDDLDSGEFYYVDESASPSPSRVASMADMKNASATMTAMQQPPPISSSGSRRRMDSFNFMNDLDDDDIDDDNIDIADLDVLLADKNRKSNKDDRRIITTSSQHYERLARKTQLMETFQAKIANSTVQPDDINNLVSYGLNLSKLQELVNGIARDSLAAGHTEAERAMQETALNRVRHFMHGLMQIVRLQAWWRMMFLKKKFVSTASRLRPLQGLYFRGWRRVYGMKKIYEASVMRPVFKAWNGAAQEQIDLKDAVDALIRRKIQQPTLTALSVSAYLQMGLAKVERDFVTERAYSMIRRLIMVKLFTHWRGEIRQQRIRWHEVHLILTRMMNKTNSRLWLQEIKLVCVVTSGLTLP